MSEDAFASILTSKTLPALHVLALGPPAHRLARHFVIPPDLLNQLAALQLSGTTFAPSLLKHRVPKLFILLRDSAVDFPPGIPSSFRHISISFPATILPGPPASVEYLTYDMTWYQQALDAVAALPDLETLWLPLVFHPSTPVNPSVHIPTAVNSFKDKVIEVCDTKGVKVRWRSRPFSATSSLTFCLDFLDYAEELNAAQATTGNAAA